ncbi:MAG: 3-dehydroquinate synthase [Candidatus Eremiobacteraeota bacterium]|nr:3-dehydroquinate synthase [Candidatus Eremiobacteraeota bacterium]
MHQLEIICPLPSSATKLYIGAALMEKTALLLREASLEGPLFIVTNRKVGPLYGEKLALSLKEAGYLCYYTEIPDGERYKTMTWAQRLLDLLVDCGMERTSTLIGLGGGVVCDISGFVASTYMRGIPHVLIPTTLLAQVDASIGGKTGVDHRQGKNMIGTFYHPRLIISDTDLLATLAKRHLACGMAEVIKSALIASPELFELLDKASGRAEALEEIIFQTSSIKASVVMNDPREQGIRAHLNLGHTLGHAIETATGFRKYLHGEAVAIGLRGACLLAERMGRINHKVTERVVNLLKAWALPVKLRDCDSEAVLSALQHDKKKKGKVRFVLPWGIGHVAMTDEVPESLVETIVQELSK